MASDKTEKATPKKKQDARKKGNVAKSQEINGAAVLGAGVIGITAFGPTMVNDFASAMRSSWDQISQPGAITTAAGLHSLFNVVIHVVLTTMAPIAGLCFCAGFLANVVQVGV